jgi:hypothetical protein
MPDPTDQPQHIGAALASSALSGVAARATARAEEVRAAALQATPPEPGPEPFGDDLDGWELDTMLDDDGQVRTPDDDAHADKLLGVLAYLERQKAKVARTAEHRIGSIKTWQVERTEVVQRDIDRIAHQLEQWARAMHEGSGGKTVTWKLPSGTLALRKARTKIHVLDDKETPEMLARAGRYDVLTDHPATYTVDRKAVAELVKKPEQRGPALSEQIGMPQGYVAHHVPAPGTDPGDGEYLPGVYLLVPIEARTFEAKVS